MGIVELNAWVTSFYMAYRTSNKTTMFIHNSGLPLLFEGNNDVNSTRTSYLREFIQTNEVFIVPFTWTQSICMKAELHGFSTSTSIGKYRCPEDGSRKCEKAICYQIAPLIHHCLCHIGYQGAGGNCFDIDECSTANKWLLGEKCFNTDGSYEIVCLQGYVKINNTCQDVDECAIGDICPFRSVCENTIGSYKCICNATGYLTDKGRICRDVNECYNSSLCVDSATCINIDGGYRCYCNEGFTGNATVNCTDIDECGLIPSLCEDTSSCVNTLGSYICICPMGHTTIERKCQDINECFEGQQCDYRSVCVNTPGSYMCECRVGYSRGILECEDINECDKQLDKCGEQANCYNTDGSYFCTCRRGYHGNGYFCSGNEQDAELCEQEGICPAKDTVYRSVMGMEAQAVKSQRKDGARAERAFRKSLMLAFVFIVFNY